MQDKENKTILHDYFSFYIGDRHHIHHHQPITGLIRTISLTRPVGPGGGVYDDGLPPTFDAIDLPRHVGSLTLDFASAAQVLECFKASTLFSSGKTLCRFIEKQRENKH